MFLQTMSLITEDRLIYSCTPKLSLSLFVTTVWTLEVSTCGSPFQASEGRLAQLMMILAVTSFLLLTMEILATVCMNNFVFFVFDSFGISYYPIRIMSRENCARLWAKNPNFYWSK